MKPLTLDQLEHVGTSIITVKGTDNCLGDLMHFDGKGTFCATYGLVPVTKEQADIHNKALDEARLKGMDDNCEVGQGGFAYWTLAKQGTTPVRTVTTFLGSVIAAGDKVWRVGRNAYFWRAGKTYRGRLCKDGDAFNFRRVK